MHPAEYKVTGQRRPIDKSTVRRIVVAGVVALPSHGASVPNTKGIRTRSDGVESRLNKLAAAVAVVPACTEATETGGEEARKGEGKAMQGKGSAHSSTAAQQQQHHQQQHQQG